ncbi:MAG: hypothetical protein EA378_06060 [Phycisphaerales bacterium]|nr:MAG: hypothetical protein EA378_06060 [Phycisphaerales bacterium]
MHEKPRNSDGAAPGEAKPGAGAPRPRGLAALRLWQWGVVALSVLIMGLGIALPLLADTRQTVAVDDRGRVVAAVETEADGTARTRAGTPIVGGFLPSGGGATPGADGTPGDEPGGTRVELEQRDYVSPAVFRAGFSFFVGFAIAFALRQFVKISVVALGLFFLAMFGLQYAGLIEVKWGVLEARYDAAGGWLASEFDSFRAFMTGYLPSAALATTGLAAGFAKR